MEQITQLKIIFKNIYIRVQGTACTGSISVHGKPYREGQEQLLTALC